MPERRSSSWERVSAPNAHNNALPQRPKRQVSIVSQKRRAQFELRKLRLSTEEGGDAGTAPGQPPPTPTLDSQSIQGAEDTAYRSDTTTDDEFESALSDRGRQATKEVVVTARSDTVKVVRLAWVQESLARGRVLDYREYLVFEAVKDKAHVEVPSAKDIMRRALKVAATSPQSPTSQHTGSRRFGHISQKPPSFLAHETTEENVMAHLPPIPESLKTKYACQRATRVHPPNEAFIQQLKEVEELRAMSGDVDGARAYADAIASLSAYPYKLQSPLGK